MSTTIGDSKQAIDIVSDSILVDLEDVRVTRYSNVGTKVKYDSASNKMKVEKNESNYLLKTDKKKPKLGVMLVGWGGNNGSTLTASLIANKQNIEWKTRRGVQKSNWYGSIVMSSTINLGLHEKEGEKDSEVFVPMNHLAPFVDPNDIVVGGWDISKLNLAESMERSQVLDYELQRLVAPAMVDMIPLPSIYSPDFIASNQSGRVDNTIDGTKAEQYAVVRQNIADFRTKNGLDKVIVLWTANTERICDVMEGVHDTADALLAAIESNHEEVSPSTIFACAAIMEGCCFINGSPQNTCVPGVVELAERQGVSIGGDDFKSGQTKMKSVLTDFLISSGIKPVSIVSYNHLGNNDGKNLAEAKQFRSKEISKTCVVDDMVASNEVLYPVVDGVQEHPDHCIVIKYVPAVGDSKRALDEYESEIFMGGRSTISIHNVCEDSLLAAPLMMDLILLMELFSRVSVARSEENTENVEWENLHSVASMLSFLLKAPMVPSHAPVVNALMKQRKGIETLLRAMIGLPPVDDLCLQHRLVKK